MKIEKGLGGFVDMYEGNVRVRFGVSNIRFTYDWYGDVRHTIPKTKPTEEFTVGELFQIREIARRIDDMMTNGNAQSIPSKL